MNVLVFKVNEEVINMEKYASEGYYVSYIFRGVSKSFEQLKYT